MEVMISKKKLSWLYHLIIKRDIIGPIEKMKYGHIGNNTILYKTSITDNEKLITIGDNTTILRGTRLQLYTKQSNAAASITIGNNCYIGYNNSFLAGGKIIIENNVLMASNILISSENHSMDPEDKDYYMDQPLSCADVKICEGTWIGEKVCILPGVTIGKKCIIGAASIVTHSIPDYCIAAGNPARVIKQYDFEQHKWIKVVK